MLGTTYPCVNDTPSDLPAVQSVNMGPNTFAPSLEYPQVPRCLRREIRV